MIVPICDQVRVCDWCSLGPASLFGHWRCPAWSLTLTTWLHSFQNKYLSPTKLIWTHGILGSPEPYGALLTNDRLDQQCSVDGVMGPTYGPSLRGRQDSKLFGTGLPIIPWAMGAEQCWLPAINNINPMKIGEYKILLYESS